MKNRPLLFFGLLVALSITIIVFYQIQSRPPVTIVSGEVLMFYDENCARCHGVTGDGADEYPPLVDNGLSEEEIKTILLEGGGEMPAFSNIGEPLFSQLAAYISKL